MTSISERAIANATPSPVQTEKPSRVCDKCGQDLPQPRNINRHKMFFGLLKPAFNQWPEKAPFQATDIEDFRAKVLIHIGWRTEEKMLFSGGTKGQMIAAMTAWMSQPRKKQLRIFESIDGGMIGYAPKSISWSPSCPEHRFRNILDDTIAFFEATIGVKIEELKREHENET